MYAAYIRQIQNIRKHPNADRLMVGEVMGYTVVVGLDTKEGDIGIFFPTDGQLSEEYCAANNLIGYIDPETGDRKGGFFDEKRRVKAQTFRKVKSEGYFAPLSSVAYTFEKEIDPSVLAKIDSFTEINGHEICKRYETPQTQKAARQNKSNTRPNDIATFPKHKDTAQFLIECDHIPVGSILYITEKLHGTSHRQGMVRVRQNLSLWKKAINKGFEIILHRKWYDDNPYQHLIGTRNTILGDGKKDYYMGDNFRYNAAIPVELVKRGVILYGEIVGYTSTGGYIMPPHSTDKTVDKSVRKMYGDTIAYTYGNKPGECTLYIYRIVVTEDDGRFYEMSYESMVEYAKTMLHVECVPLLHPPIVYDGDKEKLVQLVTLLADGPSVLDGSHIREGVCIRVEGISIAPYTLKYKSFLFRILEGLVKDNDNYVDIEEAS